MSDEPQKNDGGPAFPYSALTPEGPQMYGDSKGMTRRQYYAGKALQGFLASATPDSNIDENHAAAASWTLADAMLKWE